MRHRIVALLALALTVLGLAPPAPAQAASLVTVTGFGSNPGNLTMHLYRPSGLPAGAPLVVALHGCTQTAQDYYANSGWAELADRHGFAVVFPQTSSANNGNACFNWFQTGDTTRGQGEALSVRQMVSHAVSSQGLDGARVYVTGLSAGGAMTAVMLATYPEVFAGGSVVAGLPFRCATTVGAAFGCMSSPPDRTPQQWGDLARNGHPGYGGARPVVSIWHGTSDTTVVPAAARESRDQFTNLAGVGQTPTATRSLPGGTTLEEYGGGAVRLYSVQGMGHGTPVDPGPGADQCGHAAAYFLDTICSAHRDAVAFGLATGGSEPDPDPDPDPDPEPTCVTDDNYAHTVAGRAYQSGGYAYAVGSGDLLGLWNTYTTTSLAETSPGHWELGC